MSYGEITIRTQTTTPALGGLLGLEHEPWTADSLCRTTDPEAFFPEKGGSTREAKAVCARCPVQAECLDYALAHEERFGIWGGLSERERRKVDAARKQTPLHTCARPGCDDIIDPEHVEAKYCSRDCYRNRSFPKTGPAA